MGTPRQRQRLPSSAFRWYRHVRFQLAHRLTRPVDQLFNRFPRLEIGLSQPQLTRIACQHVGLAGRRAVQITDLHLDCYRPRHDAILETIAAMEPDWIFITGDLITTPSGLASLFLFLSRLRRMAPVYVTLGNHDHYSGVPVGRFIELAECYKLHLLINQCVCLPLPTGELVIVGLDDPATHRADVSCIPAKTPERFILLLAHAPNVLELLDERHSVDLILCGHSHGGQWRIPRVRPLWLPYGSKGRSAGHYVKNGHWLYVNRGLGWSLMPIRWNCPPEIVLVEWHRPAGSRMIRPATRPPVR